MDAYEASRTVFSRIQSLDSENASKIMGLLLIQDHGEQEMIRLAFGPESLLHSLILRARNELGLSSNTSSAVPSRRTLPPPLTIPNSSRAPWDSTLFSDFQSPKNETRKTLANPVSSPLSFSSPPFYGSNDLTDEQLFPSYGRGGDPGAWSRFPHRRSCSVNDVWFNGGVDDVTAGFGWKPCLYYARGYCKNGAGCRFIHGGDSDSPTATVSQFMANSFPYSPSKCKNYDTQRVFGSQCSAGMATPSSRQIYLTFPADSTFREEHVSNYFSMYGPVQDVRIPYQQKRMFGFVTFVYAETVKLILAKGNPHFVCDARVLVKPYKEKTKVPDQFRKQQVDRVEHSSPCSTPTGLDSSDPLNLHQGGRGGYNIQDILWKRKLEEQVDLQQAIELQSQRLMDLQLFDNSNPSTSPPLKSPTDHSPSIFKNIPANVGTEIESGKESASSFDDGDLQESFEHNLPDSPFASPTKSAAEEFVSVFSEASAEMKFGATSSPSNDPNIASSLLLASSTLDMAPFNSCYFPMPRFPPSQETIGM